MAPTASLWLDFSAAPGGPPADLLRQKAEAAISGAGSAAELHRLLLTVLVSGRALVELPGGGFGLRSVAIQQLGEAMIAALKQAPSDVAAAYKTPGLALKDMCDQVVAAGLAERLAVGKATHLLPRPHWLQPYARAASPASPPRRVMLVRLQPQPAQLKQAPFAAAAAKAPAEGAVELILRPPPSQARRSVSRGNAVMLLGWAVDGTVPGDSLAAVVQRLALKTLLHLGIEKVEQLRFRQRPVPLHEARLKLEEVMSSKAHSGPAKAFRSLFYGSLLEVLDSPAVAPLVRISSPPAADSKAEEGWQRAGGGQSQGQVQLLIGLLRHQLPAGCRAEEVPASGQVAQEAPVGVELDEAGCWVFHSGNGGEEAAAWWEAEAGEEPAAQAAWPAAPLSPPPALGLPAQAQTPALPVPPPPTQLPGATKAAQQPSQLHTRVARTEQEAAAAVAALLAAPQLALSCKLQPDGSLVVVTLCSPASSGSGGAPGISNGSGGGGGAASVFPLAGMAPAVRQAVMRHLARLLQSPDVVKLVHDCRAASEALFHEYESQLGPVWDTQVAFGLMQHIALLGSAEAEAGVDPPASLGDLCLFYSLPPGPSAAAPSLAERLARDPQLLSHTPLDARVLEHAAASVAPLCALREQLTADLGRVAALRVPHLSHAFSRWNLELAAFASTARPPRQWLQQLLELAPLAD
ncbi:hypothetical protein ABPG75_012390 [Micractinium tetrahymenae]